MALLHPCAIVAAGTQSAITTSLNTHLFCHPSIIEHPGAPGIGINFQSPINLSKKHVLHAYVPALFN